MSFFRTYEEYDAACERAREDLPVCEDCKEPIIEDYYDIDGLVICPECLQRYKVEDVSCDFCDREDDTYFNLFGDIYCSECMEKYRKGL